MEVYSDYRNNFSRADMFIMTNSKYFESYQLAQIKQRLDTLDDSRWNMLEFVQFQDPIMILIVSLVAGALGVDRFVIGDTGLGVGKLITCGGLGIWMLIDLFFIMPATRRKNFEKLMQVIA